MDQRLTTIVNCYKVMKSLETLATSADIPEDMIAELSAIYDKVKSMAHSLAREFAAGIVYSEVNR